MRTASQQSNETHDRILHRLINWKYRSAEGRVPSDPALHASMLAGLAKTRHPATKAAAKAASQAPAQGEECRKRGYSTGKPAHMRTSGEENASLRKGASILASLRNGPSKKQRPLGEPRELPLRPISTCKRCSEAARAPSAARHGRLKPTAGFSPRHRPGTSRPFVSSCKKLNYD